MATPPEHRPLSRRLMVMLFVLMMTPVGGWYFLGALAHPDLWAEAPTAVQQRVENARETMRLELALTLVASVVVFGLVLRSLRRDLLDPLESLAARARRTGREPWTPPESLERPDEVGDLARALDQAVTRLERQAADAVDFATDLSHELRTPLAGIRGAAELMREPDLPAPERARFANHILTESARLERMTAGLLELARADARRGERHAVPTDVLATIGEASERVAPLAASKRLGIERATLDALPTALAPVGDLARVLSVLLENAIRFSPENARIDVAARLEGDQLLIEVRDEGPGVTPENREHIFERFVSREPNGGHGSGTGLGLAIARALVEAWDGRIEIVDAGPGACFRFTVPIAGTASS